ncbi:hypothetical protein P3T65_26240 [Pseudomonas nitroreducens]|uniref:hypothetical protein n=1 Tax=Pseudomonas nitroreducens TaxID=46680 RepID=UPI0023F7AA63|nr:hypothetical protein [Pseudomonas nitroreducens]WEW97688.1 hypothetical protein P3T65_26240 [Pseudomonas nitroreducens]
MASVQHHKYVSSLPSTLEANSIYYVRVGTGFDIYVTNSSGEIVAYPLNRPRGVVGASFDGGGAAIAVGSACEVVLPYGMSLRAATILADAAGSITIDVQAVALGSYPPSSGNSIVGSSPPHLTGTSFSKDATLTGWITSLAAGSAVRFVVTACSGIARATITLEGERT